MSNPSRRGIAFHADGAANIVVFDAAGRVVARQAATKGTNFLPLTEPGVYFVVTPSPSSSPPEGERVGVRRRQASVNKVIISE